MTLVIAISPKTEEELKRVWKKASSLSPVELRLDKFDAIPWKALQDIDPFIITVGNLSADVVARAAVLCAASTTTKYLDISTDHDKTLFEEIKSSYPDVKIIASYHNFTATDEDLDVLYDNLKTFPCDVLKITTFANSSIDSLRMLLLLKNRGGDFPLIGVCMGDCGVFTRVLGPLYRSLISYCCLDEALKTAPGQLTYDDMVSTYNFHALRSSTSVFALIGDPVSFSRSHITHNAILKEYEVDAVYVKIAVNKEQFETALLYVNLLGFQGLSITMPLKYCFDKNTSYNTVRLGKDPALCNTDGQAAIDAIDQYSEIKGKQIAIIGAGPTAMSIAQAATRKGALVTLFNRSEKKVAYRFYPLKELKDRLKDFSICVQATSCGMQEGTDLDIHSEWFSKDAVVLDVVAKEKTLFLKAAKKAGATVISGVEMFIRQASKQFTTWFPHLDAAKVLDSLRKKINFVQMKRCGLHGALLPPSSKSHTLRALLFATFADGLSTIENPIMTPDTEAVIAICKNFGAHITSGEKALQVRGIGHQRGVKHSSFDAGNSGIASRFGIALSSLFSETAIWTGDYSMQSQRPIEALLKALSQLGAEVESKNGFLPCTVRGPIQAGMCTVDGTDSQPVSALLIAASLLEGTTTIHVENPGEKPWVDLTLSWLDRLGVVVRRDGYNRFEVVGRASYEPFHYVVPADWSSVLYPVAIALMTDSNITVQGVDFSDPQGDKQVIPLLERMGARFLKNEKERTIAIQGPQKLINIDIDINDTIDAISLLAVIGTYAEGSMRIYNGSNARFKECDRISCIVRQLQKMGAVIEESADGLIVCTSTLAGAAVECYEDHRMVLSLACAASIAERITTIQGTSCVQKSYPAFFDMIKELGGCVL